MRGSNLTDQELIRQYLNGVESAIEVLILRHQERIFGFIKNMIKDNEEANDVFQESFIKAIRTLKKGNYNEEGKFLPWILRIAHNLIIDKFRKDKRMPTFSGGDVFDIFDCLVLEEPNVEETFSSEAIKELLLGLIEELPEDQKLVLKMRHFYEMSFKEIAEETGVSINTALGRMRYALLNLRKMIQEKNLILSA